jgi:hypothetical protein
MNGWYTAVRGVLGVARFCVFYAAGKGRAGPRAPLTITPTRLIFLPYIFWLKRPIRWG